MLSGTVTVVARSSPRRSKEAWGSHHDAQVEVALPASLTALAALARHPHARAVADARRDLHLDLAPALARSRRSVRFVPFRHLFESDLERRLDVGALRRPAPRKTSPNPPPAAAAAEERLEEVGEAAEVLAVLHANVAALREPPPGQALGRPPPLPAARSYCCQSAPSWS